MRGLDFTSWRSLLGTLFALALVTLIGVGGRLLVMAAVQQRRERANRQINERLRTLIAAYKTLGGSFTGDLTVDPTHRRDLQRPAAAGDPATGTLDLSAERVAGSDRARRIRDAVEASLSDIILLGTEEHVRLAERAARELVAGTPVHTHDLVVALRTFVRSALDIEPIPAGLAIPMQGPSRPTQGGARDKGDRGQDGAGARGGGGGGGGGGGMSAGLSDEDQHPDHSPHA